MISTKTFSRDNIIRDSKKLPKGAYVCKIISARVDENQYGQRLVIAFDISEGEYAGYYKEKFDASNAEDKKWSGVIRLGIPKDDGSETDQWRVRSFNTALVAIEDSNSGYLWDGDEAKLKGKTVGVVFNLKEFEGNDGRVISYTQPKALTSVKSVREGTYYVPKDEPLKTDHKASEDTSWMDVSDVSDDELPFN